MHPVIFATLLCLLAPCVTLESSPLTIELKDPTSKDGVLSTEQGGVVSSSELRIQARYLTYIHQVENGHHVHRLTAEGDLALIYRGQIYLGSRLEYDFVKQMGLIDEGVTAIDFWFLGGEKIRINSDKSFQISRAFLTTDESKNMDWKIQSKYLNVDQNSVLQAKNIAFRIWNTPIFWFPRLTLNLLKPLKETPIYFRIDWDKGFWPILNIRYLLYSSDGHRHSLRLSAHPSYGFGTALETDYKSFDQRQTFQMRSYIGQKGLYYSSNPKALRFRYRLQGLYTNRSPNNRSHLHLSYDKLNDRNMQSEFSTPNFEMSTIKPTFLNMRHHRDKMILGLDIHPRINSFQGMKQELPSSFCTLHPLVLGKTKIISTNYLRVAYLDYVFAKDLGNVLPNFDAMRLEIENQLYRSFHYRGLNITPLVGFTGVFYTKSRDQNDDWQTVFHYEMTVNWTLKRGYSTFQHTIQPYVYYRGLTSPTMSLDTPYIFSIDDGFHRLEQLKGGVRNFFYFKKYPLFGPNLFTEIYCCAFFGNTPFKKTVPKIHGCFQWNLPSVALASQIGWNLEKQLLDFANVELAWTINEHVAFKTELRHRGPFDYRRSDRDNYLMEVARSTSELFHSPLSDRRNTHLTRLQIKLLPEWTARLESHVGWGRKREPPYRELRLELIGLINASWKLRLLFVHTPTSDKNSNRFSLGFCINRH